ncbi:hypothetical protein [Streptomyces sp. NBC_01340]|uniref:hypothetical protein n=1 Tax=Streptomyces sp. NBC_01340 TaxID=2903830 RepID=UPI003DA30EB9
MNGDEQLLRGRVHGHDDPGPGPVPHQTYAAPMGGPLDGLLLDVTGRRPDEVVPRRRGHPGFRQHPGRRSVDRVARRPRAPVEHIEFDL